MAADFEQVKQNIADTIYENGEELITGQVMQDRLLEMVSVTEEAINDVTNRPTAVNQMGYVILRKNKTFAEQVTQANTIYEIRYEFDLDGAEVTIPEGCELSFVGGSIDNGTIVGATSRITGCLVKFIGASLNISGTWNVPRITTSALISPTDDNSLKKLIALTDDSYDNEVVVESGEYAVDAEGQYFAAALWLKSNTKFKVIGTIKLNPSADDYASLVQIYQKENIVITGSGNLIGDRDGHTGTTGEWGHGIAIYSGENILVEGVSISKCWGDGIYVGSPAAASPKSQYIKIINCTISETRRQGISFGNTAFAEVDGCYIYNVSGTNPESGIDIETDFSGAVNENISIRNSVIDNCVKGLLVVDLVGGSSINNISIENCKISSTTNVAMRIKCDESPSIVNCDINTASGQDIIEASTAAEVILLRCKLTGNNATHAITNSSTSILKIDECSISGAEYLSTYFYKGRIADSTIDTTKFRQYGTTSSATIKDSTLSFVPSGTLKDTIIENCRMSVGALVAFDGGFSVRLVNNKITTTANISYLFYLSGSTPGFVQFDGNIIEHTDFNITNYLFQGTGHTIQFNGNVALDSGVYTTLSI